MNEIKEKVAKAQNKLKVVLRKLDLLEEEKKDIMKRFQEQPQNRDKIKKEMEKSEESFRKLAETALKLKNDVKRLKQNM